MQISRGGEYAHVLDYIVKSQTCELGNAIGRDNKGKSVSFSGN